MVIGNVMFSNRISCHQSTRKSWNVDGLPDEAAPFDELRQDSLSPESSQEFEDKLDEIIAARSEVSSNYFYQDSASHGYLSPETSIDSTNLWDEIIVCRKEISKVIPNSQRSDVPRVSTPIVDTFPRVTSQSIDQSSRMDDSSYFKIESIWLTQSVESHDPFDDVLVFTTDLDYEMRQSELRDALMSISERLKCRSIGNPKVSSEGGRKFSILCKDRNNISINLDSIDRCEIPGYHLEKTTEEPKLDQIHDCQRDTYFHATNTRKNESQSHNRNGIDFRDPYSRNENIIDLENDSLKSFDSTLLEMLWRVDSKDSLDPFDDIMIVVSTGDSDISEGDICRVISSVKNRIQTSDLQCRLQESNLSTADVKIDEERDFAGSIIEKSRRHGGNVAVRKESENGRMSSLNQNLKPLEGDMGSGGNALLHDNSESMRSDLDSFDNANAGSKQSVDMMSGRKHSQLCHVLASHMNSKETCSSTNNNYYSTFFTQQDSRQYSLSGSQFSVLNEDCNSSCYCQRPSQRLINTRSDSDRFPSLSLDNLIKEREEEEQSRKGLIKPNSSFLESIWRLNSMESKDPFDDIVIYSRDRDFDFETNEIMATLNSITARTTETYVNRLEEEKSSKRSDNDEIRKPLKTSISLISNNASSGNKADESHNLNLQDYREDARLVSQNINENKSHSSENSPQNRQQAFKRKKDGEKVYFSDHNEDEFAVEKKERKRYKIPDSSLLESLWRLNSMESTDPFDDVVVYTNERDFDIETHDIVATIRSIAVRLTPSHSDTAESKVLEMNDENRVDLLQSAYNISNLKETCIVENKINSADVSKFYAVSCEQRAIALRDESSFSNHVKDAGSTGKCRDDVEDHAETRSFSSHSLESLWCVSSKESHDPFDDIRVYTLDSDNDAKEDDIVAVIKSVRERASTMRRSVSIATNELSLISKSISSNCSTSYLGDYSSRSTRWTDEEAYLSYTSSAQPNMDQETCAESCNKGRKLRTGRLDFCHCQFECFHPVHSTSFDQMSHEISQSSSHFESSSMVGI